MGTAGCCHGRTPFVADCYEVARVHWLINVPISPPVITIGSMGPIYLDKWTLWHGQGMPRYVTKVPKTKFEGIPRIHPITIAFFYLDFVSRSTHQQQIPATGGG